QPETRSGDLRCRVGPVRAYLGSESRVPRPGGAHRQPVATVQQDLFWLWCCERRDAAATAHIRLRWLRCGVGSGCQRSVEYSRRRACGEVKRLWSPCQSTLARGGIGRGSRKQRETTRKYHPNHGRKTPAARESPPFTAGSTSIQQRQTGRRVAPTGHHAWPTQIDHMAAYMTEVADAPGLTVRTGARVHRLRVSNGAVTGVEFEVAGRLESASADRVVLCAGAIDSPRVLLRSGIGPAAELRTLGIDCVADLPGVGKNLHDHLLAPLIFTTVNESV